jgi:hypothetical protein
LIAQFPNLLTSGLNNFNESTVAVTLFDKLQTFVNIPTLFDMFMKPVMTGSLAAKTVEPRQVRKEAALRRALWVPRNSWLSLVPCIYPNRNED